MEKKQNKRNKRGFRKEPRKDADFEIPKKTADNDASWYAQNEQLMKDVASIPTSQIAGFPIDFGVIGNPRIAGIMTFLYEPTIGLSVGGESPVNVAGLNFYSYMRHMTSGSRPYTQADVMPYILAMNDIYVFIADMRRAYGLLNTYSITNRMYPKAIVNALGYDADSLLTQLSDFRAFINFCTQKAASLAVPKCLPIIERSVFLNSHVWIDSNKSGRCQTYAFKCADLRKWTPITNLGSCLVGRQFHAGAYLNLASLKVIWDDLWNVIALDSDIGIMSADIYNVFKDEGIWHLATIPEEYTVLPEYSAEMLMQIHNITITPLTTYGTGNSSSTVIPNCIQNSQGYLLQTGVRIDCDFPIPGAVIVDLPTDHVTPSDVMVATRLTTPFVQSVYNNNDQCWDSFLFATGSEIVIKAEVWTVNVLTLGGTLLFSHGDQTLPIDISVDFLGYWSNFEQAPLLYVENGSNSAPNAGDEIVSLFGDTDNFCRVDSTTISNIHRVALSSEFGLGRVGIAKAVLEK